MHKYLAIYVVQFISHTTINKQITQARFYVSIDQTTPHTSTP